MSPSMTRQRVLVPEMRSRDILDVANSKRQARNRVKEIKRIKGSLVVTMIINGSGRDTRERK